MILLNQILNISCYRKYFVCFVLGGISALIFAPYFLLFLLYITIPLLLLFISNSKTKTEAYFLGWYFGLGIFIFGLYWISNALLYNFQKMWFLYPLALVGLPILLTTIFIAPITLFLYVTRLRDTIYVSSFAILFVLSEYLRTYLLTGFPWNLIGHSVAFSEYLMQPSAIFGVYGLSLVVIYTASLPYLVIIRMIKVRICALIITISYLSLYIFGYFHINNTLLQTNGDLVIRIVQSNNHLLTNLSNKEKFQNLSHIIALSRKNLSSNIKIIIWPESAIDFLINKKLPLNFVRDLLPQDSYLVTGTMSIEEISNENSSHTFNVFNSLIVVDQSGNIIDSYDKMHLVPFGEYVPLRSILKFNKVTSGLYDLTPGEQIKTIRPNKNLPGFVPMICYEIIFPNFTFSNDRQNGTWIANITTDAWYQNSSGPYQHLTITRFRAIEQGIPLARAATTGISAMIDSFGRILDKLPYDQEGVIDTNIPQYQKNITIYTKYGNWPLLLLLFITLTAMIVKNYIFHKTELSSMLV